MILSSKQNRDILQTLLRFFCSMVCEKLTVLLILLHSVTASIDLHSQHIPYVLRHHPSLEEQNKYLPNKNCWGYEKDCLPEYSFSKPPRHCGNKQIENDFNDRIDFGYVRQQQHELMTLCQGYSSLHCSRYTKYCTGKNIYINFHALHQSDGKKKYREDLFQSGDIGGFCELNQNLLQKQSEHKSPLQSWYAELQNFTSLKFRPLQDTEHCDVIINSTVVFMKLDYGGNMFHHFCDFFNLYVSQHVNNSWFGRDIHVVMWDTATSEYFDPFSVSWKVFSKHPVTTLMDWKGKRVCARDVMFPLLPRMRNGMYYNTFVPRHCVGSNLFRAFSQHFLHRMKIPQSGPHVVNGRVKVRITLLQRGNPSKTNVYRQIRNQPELLKSLSRFDNIILKVVEYDWRSMSFEDQLRITHNTDVFIGMHGAGLAHFLFLPDWAVAFELYNCDDEHCYNDLARLRGLHYKTWPTDAPKPKAYDQGKHHKYGDNPKFWNWEFDPRTFVRLVGEAIDTVLANLDFQEAVERIRRAKEEL